MNWSSAFARSRPPEAKAAPAALEDQSRRAPATALATGPGCWAASGLVAARRRRRPVARRSAGSRRRSVLMQRASGYRLEGATGVVTLQQNSFTAARASRKQRCASATWKPNRIGSARRRRLDTRGELRVPTRPCGGRTPTAKPTLIDCALDSRNGSRQQLLCLGKDRLSHAARSIASDGFAMQVNGEPGLLPRGLLDRHRSALARPVPRNRCGDDLQLARDAGHEHAARRRHDGLRERRFLSSVRRTRHPGLAGLHVRQHGLSGRRSSVSPRTSRPRPRSS